MVMLRMINKRHEEHKYTRANESGYQEAICTNTMVNAPTAIPALTPGVGPKSNIGGFTNSLIPLSAMVRCDVMA
jgi:hypothetical protein